MIGKSLYFLLSNASDVTDIISTKIFPSRIPQVEDFPAISYHQISNVPTNQKDAVSGFDKVDFDINLWSKDYSQINTLSVAVRAALDRKSISSQGVTVDTIVFVREVDDYSDPAEIYKKILQFQFIVIR